MKVSYKHTKKGNDKIDISVVPRDVWSMDHTTALIILPLLLQLKNQMHGVPSEFVDGVGTDSDDNYCFDYIDEDKNDVFEKGVGKWSDILDQIIWAFYQVVEGNYSDLYHHGQMKVTWKPIEITNPTTGVVEKMHEMVNDNPEEHWYDHEGHRMHEERMREGFLLFGKYFMSLWD